MRYIIRETLLAFAMVIVANLLLASWTDIDPMLLNEMSKILLISLCIQPLVIYQFNR